MEVMKELDYKEFEEGKKGRERKWFDIDEAYTYLKKHKVEQKESYDKAK